jgi:hypothetical protein
MPRQSSTPNRSFSFRSLTSAVAFGVVVASVSPALAYIPASATLDAVRAVEGYPVERNYYYVAPHPHYSIGWNSVHLRSGRTVETGHTGSTTEAPKE